MKRFSPVLFLAMLFMVACPDRTPYGKAADLGLRITDSLHTAADTTDQLRINGTISGADEKTVMLYFKAVNDVVTGPYQQCVIAAHLADSKAMAYADCARDITTAISKPEFLGDFHITNAKSLQEAQAVINSVNALVQSALTAFSQFGDKGK